MAYITHSKQSGNCLMAAKHAYPNSELYAFSRSEGERAFAIELGATWAGAIEQEPPAKLDGIIDTTPVWKALVESLNDLEKGGRLVVNAIAKEEVDKDYLLRLDYQKHLWMAKEIKSVANVTRRDVREFLALAAEVPIKPTIEEFRLEDANKALIELKEGSGDEGAQNSIVFSSARVSSSASLLLIFI